MDQLAKRQPKFSYGNVVKITDGFYKGREGIVLDYRDMRVFPFQKRDMRYTVYIRDTLKDREIWIYEENLEFVKDKEA